jgi:hypothetical protein
MGCLFVDLIQTFLINKMIFCPAFECNPAADAMITCMPSTQALAMKPDFDEYGA